MLLQRTGLNNTECGIVISPTGGRGYFAAAAGSIAGRIETEV